MLIDNGEAIAYEMATLWLGLEDPDFPANELGSLWLELSSGLRTLAIMSLLSTGLPDRFWANLERSAEARVIYLDRLRRDGIAGEHHQVSGRYTSLADAIAASRFDLAIRISELSPSKYFSGREYKDDYCFAQLLGHLVQDKPDPIACESHLAEFADYLGGENTAKLDICSALLAQDRLAFDEAFESLVAEREMEIEAKIGAGELEDDRVSADRLVFVDGLALLQLAARMEIISDHEYKYCPALVLNRRSLNE